MFVKEQLSIGYVIFWILPKISEISILTNHWLASSNPICRLFSAQSTGLCAISPS